MEKKKMYIAKLFQMYPRGDLIIRYGRAHLLSVNRSLKIRTVEENHFNGLITLGHHM